MSFQCCVTDKFCVALGGENSSVVHEGYMYGVGGVSKLASRCSMGTLGGNLYLSPRFTWAFCWRRHAEPCRVSPSRRRVLFTTTLRIYRTLPRLTARCSGVVLISYTAVTTDVIVIRTEAMDEAAKNGHLDVVTWLHEHRQEGCTGGAMDMAGRHGHLDVLKFLHENRSEGCSTLAVDFAAHNGHTEVYTPYVLPSYASARYTTTALLVQMAPNLVLFRPCS